MTLLMKAMTTLTLVFAMISTALAAPLVKPGEMTSGSLLLKATEGSYLEAPRLETDYTVTVSGVTARTILTQRFKNPASGWVEGVYVFPLPEGAAVDTLKIVAGTRVIVGEVKERQEAKQIYEDAKEAGQMASLVEQERPNLFTNSVANIGPYETVVVQIEYQEALRTVAGTAQLRLPLVVAPRYNPAPLVQSVDFKADGSGYGATITDPVPDRDRITPPVLDPTKHDKINPVTITVKLNAGYALASVKSAYHPIDEKDVTPTSRIIALKAGEVPADRDFELSWTAQGTAPQVGLFKERLANQDYLLGLITPPTVTPSGPAKPREVIFVIDNSGSMEGPSMPQAKESLLFGLSQLKPSDRFNVIRFDDTMTIVFQGAVAATPQNLDYARAYVQALNANGGTEMLPALRAALAADSDTRSTHLRQVVFLTDGAIGNEQEFFSTIADRKGWSRIFMVGIGTAPNSYLMTRAAEIGRGTFTHIGDGAQVTARMQDLFTKIGQPIVTDLKAELSGATLTPDTLPDLYAGEPLLVLAEGAALSGSMKVTGKIGDQPWEITVPLAAAAPGTGLSKLMAHRKIAEFEVKSVLGQQSAEDSAKAILKVALEHQIVSSQTSLFKGAASGLQAHTG
jgi:Ca-activated chloride channel homolog